MQPQESLVQGDQETVSDLYSWSPRPPRASLVAQLVKNPTVMQETLV